MSYHELPNCPEEKAILKELYDAGAEKLAYFDLIDPNILQQSLQQTVCENGFWYYYICWFGHQLSPRLQNEPWFKQLPDHFDRFCAERNNVSLVVRLRLRVIEGIICHESKASLPQSLADKIWRDLSEME